MWRVLKLLVLVGSILWIVQSNDPDKYFKLGLMIISALFITIVIIGVAFVYYWIDEIRFHQMNRKFTSQASPEDKNSYLPSKPGNFE